MAGVELNAFDEQYWYHGFACNVQMNYHLTSNGDFLLRRSKKKKKKIFLSVFEIEEGYKNYLVLELDHDEKTGRGIRASLDDVKKVYNIVMKKPNCKTPKIREKWRLSSKDITMGEQIGEGHFALVYKATYNGKDVAVKMYKQTMSEDTKKKFFLEGFILGINNHPNILKLLGIVAERGCMMIVTEYLKNGNLLDYMKSDKHKSTLSEKMLISMCKDVASGMAYLERKKCFHRDLAARNCLVTDNLTVKISDFGLAKVADYEDPSNLDRFPMYYTAPEVLQNGTFTSMCDVWSFGIVMWEIFSKGKFPYPGKTFPNSGEMHKQLKAGYRMDAPEGTPDDCYKLMLKCWKFSPEDRFNFKKIVKKLKRMLAPQPTS